MNQDLPLQAVPPRAELEISLAEILAPLRRRSRLILVGTGACWAILLLLHLLAPPKYSCEATLVLPDVILPPEASLNRSDLLKSELLDVISGGRSGVEPTMSGGRSGIEPTLVGIPPVLYKKLERSLSEGAVMQSAFSGKLKPAAIERMRHELSEHVSPVASGTKDDIQKLEKDDTISAVKLSYESYVADRSRDAVYTLAWLVRETLITSIAMEQIQSETVAFRREALRLFRRRMDLLAINGSLEKLTTDLERLARDLPESRAASAREVVDTREGGYRFLPPQIQLVGARARYADNLHMIRVCEQALSLHTLRLRFLGRLQQRILNAGTPVVSDLPQVIGSELQAFLREEGSRNPDLPYVQTEMEALRDKLAAFRSDTRFIQHPTTRAESRASLAAALASLALVVFIAAAFVADLWQRSGGAPSIEDAAVSRKSA